MTDTCCICLDDIDKSALVQKFSCGHTIHHKCFIQLMINKCTKFIECPLCRKTNYNIEWPDAPYNKILHECCMTRGTCIHKYENGERREA